MTKVVYYYMGKRLTRGDKLTQVFLDDAGKEITFKGRISGVLLGYGYEVNKSSAGKISISARPKEADVERHEKSELWRSLTVAAETEYGAKRIRAKASSNKNLLREVEYLKRFCKGLKYSERRSLFEWIIDEIEREEMEAMNKAFNARIAKAFKQSRKGKRK